MSRVGLKKPELFTRGFYLQKFLVPESLKQSVREENWIEVDREFTGLAVEGGAIYELLLQFHEFSTIELMISIRDGQNEWEEDGIWHDDGSRVFAFSLSLTLDPGQIDGGHLELRRKDDEANLVEIPTPEFGTAILFLTGVHGYEHRTRRVLRGRRVILVGWCT